MNKKAPITISNSYSRTEKIQNSKKAFLHEYLMKVLDFAKATIICEQVNYPNSEKETITISFRKPIISKDFEVLEESLFREFANTIVLKQTLVSVLDKNFILKVQTTYYFNNSIYLSSALDDLECTISNVFLNKLAHRSDTIIDVNNIPSLKMNFNNNFTLEELIEYSNLDDLYLTDLNFHETADYKLVISNLESNIKYKLPENLSELIAYIEKNTENTDENIKLSAEKTNSGKYTQNLQNLAGIYKGKILNIECDIIKVIIEYTLKSPYFPGKKQIFHYYIPQKQFTIADVKKALRVAVPVNFTTTYD